jgi:hypothetical protein
MKRYKSLLSLKWVAALLLVVGFVSCANEEIISEKTDVIEGVETEINLAFTSATPSVQTRGALDVKQEYKVYNLYVFVFDKTGKKEYGHLFELNATNSDDKFFDVHEKENSEDAATTSGKIKMKISSGEKRIYAVANVPAGDSHASLLNDLEEIDDIEGLKNNVVISTKTVDRPNDRLVMSGWLKNNSQSGTDPEGYCVISPSGENNISTIKLVRVDARVTFNISLDKQSDRTNIIEKSFTPLKFIVKNVPTKAYLYGKADNELVSGCEYFSSNNGEFANFETKDENGVSSFTFYMMENKQSTIGLNDYNQREKEKKNPLNYEYEYAPATATLVEMTGSYYEKYTDRDGSIKERHADVKYTVHLGYVGGDANDFRCQRNTTYIYNVYVQTVDKIRLEVTSYNDGGKTVEEQPGAEGDIIETDKFYQFDSHFDHTMVIFKKSDVEGRAGFRVKTPFDDGYYFIADEFGTVPENARPVKEAKDYKWVTFIRHEKRRSDRKYYYNTSNYVNYVPSKAITIDGLLEELHTTDETVGSSSVYDANGQAVYTMYIDEFYYPCDPRNGYYGERDRNGNLTVQAKAKEGTDFWKQFVNQPNREVHILCNTQFSEDKESSLTTSAVMVSQRSIKTFYNEKAGSDLKTAWGLETVNETGRIAKPESNPWNTSNSAKNGLWNFFSQSNNFSSNSWSTSLNKKDKLLYACLQRNRDDNGNGRIDADEVKWYPAAIDQYTDIWVGRAALPIETYLYSNEIPTSQGYRRYLSSDGKELYAEEGASIGSFGFVYANSIWSTSDKIEKKYDYRCLRNLGRKTNKPNSAEDKPQNYVTQKGNTLTLTYMKSESLRSGDNYMKGEITSHDESSNLNRPYTAFEFKTGFVYKGIKSRWSWNEINTLINRNPAASPCAEFNKDLSADEPKWRLPNQRELSLMTSNYTGWSGESYVQSRTGSSLPVKRDDNNGYSGGYANNKPFVTLATNDYAGPVRCVRDVRDVK